MKKIILLALIIGAMISCNQNENKTESDKSVHTKNTEVIHTEEKQNIEALLREYEKSLNTSDAKLVQRLYTKDGVFMPPEAASGIGSEGILKSYEFVFSQIQLNIQFFIEEIKVEGNMAFPVPNSKSKVKIHANGIETQHTNRELFVFEKVDGEWKIDRYMLNDTESKNK